MPIKFNQHIYTRGLCDIRKERNDVDWGKYIDCLRDALQFKKSFKKIGKDIGAEFYNLLRFVNKYK